MSQTDQLIANSRSHTAGVAGSLPGAPARRVAVLTCMDARLNLYGILGLSEGDAHVIRNAGGVVSDDAIRSLSISQNLLGTEEIILIHHTSCGMLNLEDEEFADRLEAETGERPGWPALGFPDLEGDLRDGIEKIESSPFVPRTDSVRGFVYEVETGALREVD